MTYCVHQIPLCLVLLGIAGFILALVGISLFPTNQTPLPVNRSSVQASIQEQTELYRSALLSSKGFQYVIIGCSILLSAVALGMIWCILHEIYFRPRNQIQPIGNPMSDDSISDEELGRAKPDRILIPEPTAFITTPSTSSLPRPVAVKASELKPIIHPTTHLPSTKLEQPPTFVPKKTLTWSQVRLAHLEGRTI